MEERCNKEEEEEDAALREQQQQQQAYEYFMRTGKMYQTMPSTPPASSRTTTTSSPPRKQKSSHKKQQQQQQQQQHHNHLAHVRQVQTAVDAFYKILVQEWLHVDDQMRLVVESIANLRERIWVANQSAQPRGAQPTTTATRKEDDDDAWWKTRGFRGSKRPAAAAAATVVPVLMTSDDAHLALSHSLLAHERMLTALRHGLSQLHQAQEALGRRLDDIVARADAADDNNDNNQVVVVVVVDECLHLYRALAAELYRKQLLGPSLWESANDRLLDDDDVTADHESEQHQHPRKVAHATAAQWSRSHPDSVLSEMQPLLQRIEEKYASG